MANAKRKCGYKPCGIYFRPESANDSRVVFCSPEHKILKLTTKPQAKAKPAKKKLKSMARIKEDCKKTLQRLVRVKAAVAANKNGLAQCVTCNRWEHYTNLQGGHYIERGKSATAMLEENVNPQCMQCNAWSMKTTSGVLAYREYMVLKLGEKGERELWEMSKIPKKYTRAEVEAIHADFKQRLAELEAEL